MKVKLREKIKNFRGNKLDKRLKEAYKKLNKEEYKIYSERDDVRRDAMYEYEKLGHVVENGVKIPITDIKKGDSLFLTNVSLENKSYGGPFCFPNSCVITDNKDYDWIWIQDVKETNLKQEDFLTIFDEKVYRPDLGLGMIGGIHITKGSFNWCTGDVYEMVTLEGKDLEIYRLKLHNSSTS